MTRIPLAAFEVLRAAEARLQDIIAEAAREARYNDVSAIAELSAHLRVLTSGVEDGLPAEIAAPREPETAELSPALDDVDVSTSASKKPPLRRGGYPRFCKLGDQLTKIGWSNSAKREYEHRVPYEGVVAVVQYLTSLKPSRFPVTAEAIVEALRKAENSTILGYQVYVVVAWLRAASLVVPNGRQGYSLASKVELLESVEELWRALPSCGQ